MKSQKIVKVRRLNTPNPGSGCGSDGRAFASNSRGLRFESNHRQNLGWTFSVDCIEKDENKEKGAI